MNQKYKQTLQRLGASSESVGYWYMLSALEIASADAHVLTYVTKLVYLPVGRQYQVSPECVEAALRRTVKNVWLYGNRDLLEEIVHHTLPEPPTTSHFLGQMVAWCEEAALVPQ